ncbi:MAG: hypothetical protein SPL35_01165 [Bacteroidales bacterium]|nr:hypothetical protein [Bacteroidales bacterium]
MRRLFIILVFALLATGCEKNSGQNLECLVTLNAVVQGQSSAPVSIVADRTLSGTMFRNINTLDNYNIPAFSNGTAQLQVLKGLYMITFDADAVFADGTEHRVRAAQYNSPEKSVRLVDDNCTVTLYLTVLQ